MLMLAGVWCAQHAAWIISSGLHLALALCVAGVALHHRERAGALGIEAVLHDGDSADSSGFDSINTPGGGGLEATIETVSPRELASLTSAVLLNESGDLAALQGQNELLGGSGTGGGAGGSGGGSGGGFGDGHGAGIGPGFFGTQGEGRTFIYIVDMSGSMGGKRFQRAIAELNRSINRLKPHQEFYVYFFNDSTKPLFDKYPTRLLIATPANKGRATRWISSRRPNGLTNPMFALEQALAFKPDVIFLLTDGELENAADVRDMLRKRNQHGTTIHTIAFESSEGSATLEAIAKENKGVYRFVK